MLGKTALNPIGDKFPGKKNISPKSQCRDNRLAILEGKGSSLGPHLVRQFTEKRSS